MLLSLNKDEFLTAAGRIPVNSKISSVNGRATTSLDADTLKDCMGESELNRGRVWHKR